MFGFSFHGFVGLKVLQITSAEPQDGKTTVAANMALAMAHAGKKVLLIDADLRCPKVHQIFRLRHEIGLSDVISGEIQFENAIQTCEIPGLSLLTAGMTPSNPAELLGGMEIENLLRQLRSEYDYVIVDTPPLMAVSDPAIMASRVDGLVLVVRAGKNKLTTIRDGCELLQTMGVTLLGAVVNDVAVTDAQKYGDAYQEGSAATSRGTIVSEPVQVMTPALVSVPRMPASSTRHAEETVN